MVVVSRGRLLPEGSFPLIAGRGSGIGADAGGAVLSEGLGELAAQPLIVLGQFPVAAACSRLNPGVEAGYQPGLPPVGRRRGRGPGGTLTA
jgi:hypothetical protein